MSDWKLYRKAALTEMRAYRPGESMAGIAVNQNDRLEEGGMIARNPSNSEDQWYISKRYFEDNYIPA